MRGLIWFNHDELEISRLFYPLTLALSPRGTVVKLENRLRGERGQSKGTCNPIPDLAKYEDNNDSAALQTESCFFCARRDGLPGRSIDFWF